MNRRRPRKPGRGRRKRRAQTARGNRREGWRTSRGSAAARPTLNRDWGEPQVTDPTPIISVNPAEDLPRPEGAEGRKGPNRSKVAGGRAGETAGAPLRRRQPINYRERERWVVLKYRDATQSDRNVIATRTSRKNTETEKRRES